MPTKNKIPLKQPSLDSREIVSGHAERRKKAIERPIILAPSRNSEPFKLTPDRHKQWRPALKAPGIPCRSPYNCGRTYATICSMSNMNPAFIAQQPGRSVQMLLSTYARWLKPERLQIGIESVSGNHVQPATH
ncbi:hypothetical protein C1886_03330 [Pseudomonas sp. FW300-N1A1]|uniref:hypothetical protein n=1 Tax=Pseudomonas sp. FW300-N1A1 TaxID=2075555 RepID=UPI000CD1D8AA|nr:hypothetical protein C1886_03330 [Pseudomonas sp. FW300-N1A1]